MSLFHCCKVTNDHKKQNKKGGSGGAQGEVQLVLWEIQVASGSIQVPILTLPGGSSMSEADCPKYTELEAPWRQKPSLTQRPLEACLHFTDLMLESK